MRAGSGLSRESNDHVLWRNGGSSRVTLDDDVKLDIVMKIDETDDNEGDFRQMVLSDMG